MTPLGRIKESAELITGRRDGKHITYETHDPKQYEGANAKYLPKELFERHEAHEMGPNPATLATTLVKLIEHITETAEILSDIANVLPVHDIPGSVLTTELKSQIRHLTEGLDA